MKIARGNAYEHLGQHLAQESHLSNISLLSRVYHTVYVMYIYIYIKELTKISALKIFWGGGN